MNFPLLSPMCPLSLSLSCSLKLACFHAYPSAQVNRVSMKHYRGTDCVENPATYSDSDWVSFPKQNTFALPAHWEKQQEKTSMYICIYIKLYKSMYASYIASLHSPSKDVNTYYFADITQSCVKAISQSY